MKHHEEAGQKNIKIVIGIVTLPILLLAPLPIGPAWATDTIAFFLSDIGYTVVGLRMRAQREDAHERVSEALLKG